MKAYYKSIVLVFTLCLISWTCKASPVKSGSPGTIDTSGNTAPSTNDDGTIVQSPDNTESPTEVQSPGGFDSGSPTEVDTDNDIPATGQTQQYEYIGPLFVRLKVTMGSALFTKLVEQATDVTMVALKKEAVMDRKYDRFRGCEMFEYLYSENKGRMIAAKPTRPGQRSRTAYGKFMNEEKRLKLKAQFEIKKCARDALNEKKSAS
ncbi:uncharacterized protein EV420DRAFT_92953 [Desarmillaria tabescens]|uniref:Uncharacterized protein n=1 Tax=Armillaria tabescens TaxID=1929756 RepID=A0AA39T7N9_ARMTA|nr:uncharacterized protein EV420DRAFT_92953 [Desarmillaria tabescens]KAK0470156.1 hypothetical protein EV420DRAFT_92953 [Desarmillaria tabescens]